MIVYCQRFNEYILALQIQSGLPLLGISTTGFKVTTTPSSVQLTDHYSTGKPHLKPGRLNMSGVLILHEYIMRSKRFILSEK